jgi:hypothetical protein
MTDCGSFSMSTGLRLPRITVWYAPSRRDRVIRAARVDERNCIALYDDINEIVCLNERQF